MEDKRTLIIVLKLKMIGILMQIFVAKLLKYILLMRDILTFLGLNYRVDLLITLYLVVLGISIPKKSDQSDNYKT